MKRIIAWFAENGIAANLLMVLILAGGASTLPRLKQEVFPELSSDSISVSVEYLGAAPEEVEEAICQRIEEAVYGLAGIKRVTSTASEGVGQVVVELLPGTDPQQLLDQVKTRVDGIDTFPAETERPLVEEMIMRRQVIEVAVSGNADERSLRRIGERVRDEIAALPEISLVELAGARPYEVSIEVSEDALMRHGLSFDDVARAVRMSSLDLPGGSVKTVGGEFLLRAKGQAYRGEEFERIALISARDGTRVTLGEIATVVDGFADVDASVRFDGEPSVLVQVFRVGDQGALDIAAAVKRYIAEAEPRMPEGISLTTWQDDSAILQSRLHLLIDNGMAGLVLVCIVLALFLRLGLALWVAIGIPISFLGAVWLLPGMDVSVNLISLFAFIIVLGLVVDDAIILAENIYSHLERGKKPLRAAIDGAQEVAGPVIFAVLTSIAAFMPLLTIPGNMGKVMKLIPAIVIATLIFSLIESILILPTHLSHLRKSDDERRGVVRTVLAHTWDPIQTRFAAALQFVVTRAYAPTLDFCLRWRYASIAVGVATLMLIAGFIGGRHMKFVFFPEVDADNVVAILSMPQGTPAEVTAHAVQQIENAAVRLREEVEGDSGSWRERDSLFRTAEAAASDSKDEGGETRIFKHIMSSVGTQPYRESQDIRRGKSSSFAGGHVGEVNIELFSAEDRPVTSTELARRWRELTGPVPDAVELTYTASLFSVGEAINVQLAAPEIDELRGAAAELKEALAGFAGVRDIADSFRAGKREWKLSIRPEAETLGPHALGSRSASAASVLRRRGSAHPARARRCARHGALS